MKLGALTHPSPRISRPVHDVLVAASAVEGVDDVAACASGSSAIALPVTDGVVPTEVKLLPAGPIKSRDGRGPWRMSDAAAVIVTSQAYHDGQDIPIDFDHQLDHTEENGGGAPASGWITQLEARPDGIWGRVEWTEAGAHAIQKREYRFLSPVFAHNRQGEVLALLRAGLTNKPNLPALTAINSTTTLGDAMSDSLKAALQRLAAILGLPTTSDEVAIEAAANAIVESEKLHREALTALRGRVKLGDKSTVDEIFVAAQATATVDPKKFVPVETHTAVVQKLEQLERGNAEVAVNAAIESGKIAPANKDWAIAYCARDPQGFAEFVGRTTPIVKPGEERRSDAQVPATKLTDAQKAICAATGVSEADFLKTLNARKEG